MSRTVHRGPAAQAVPAAHRREQQRREQQRRAERRQRGMVVAGVAAAVLAGALAIAAGRSGAKPKPAPVPASLLAPVDRAIQGQPVDGISCQSAEQVLFHIHAHLAIFVDGAPAGIPEGIGIPNPQTQNTSSGPFVVGGSCFYWLHSHTADGIIHIESPVVRTYTLGNYFDIWGQPLDAAHVGPAAGPVMAFLNGRPFTGNPRDIPLDAHAVIQIDGGTRLRVVPPQGFTFPAGL